MHLWYKVYYTEIDREFSSRIRTVRSMFELYDYSLYVYYVYGLRKRKSEKMNTSSILIVIIFRCFFLICEKTYF